MSTDITDGNGSLFVSMICHDDAELLDVFEVVPVDVNPDWTNR
jgi:hypothetical protein